MKVYLAQLNPKVGDLAGNFEQIKETFKAKTGADLLVFSELCLTGYPPWDLLFRKDFLQAVQEYLDKLLAISREYPQVIAVLGLPWQEASQIFNAALVVKAGEILHVHKKVSLTQFCLFEEQKYFSSEPMYELVQIGEELVALALGLELDEKLALKYKELGATIIINPVAIPFQAQREELALEQLQDLAKLSELTILRVNQVGANDQLIFAGGSVAVDRFGSVVGFVPKFTQAGVLIDLCNLEYLELPRSDSTEEIYQALALGIKDYVYKNSLKKVIIGLSGGLDSAVVACLAVEALGAENVWGITQPGPYSTPSSVEDAQNLAQNLGIKFDILSIESLYQAVLTSLDEFFVGTSMNVAEENIQARLRGNLLMALSNKFGGLVLTNSNKSELAVGYCTLYGDMSGGLAVIADVYKTIVYQLAYYINREHEIIPWNTIEKPPSAELRPNQRDDESLPPYDVLDAIIEHYLHEQLTLQEIVEAGFDEQIARWVLKTIDNNEYKRRQAALILQVTSPILGQARQVPLTACKQFS